MNLLFSLHPAKSVSSFLFPVSSKSSWSAINRNWKPETWNCSSGLPFPPRTRGTGRIEHL